MDTVTQLAGQYGREVSEIIKELLPIALEEELNMSQGIPKALNSAFARVNQAISKSNIDIKFSGSTCVSLLFDHQRIYCANVCLLYTSPSPRDS